MTRRHFIAIANILRAYNESEKNGWSYNLNEAFADFCEGENPQFNRERFLLACEVGCEICGQGNSKEPECDSCIFEFRKQERKKNP